MKVAQNDETNPDTQPVRPPPIPSIPNTQLSPSGSSDRTRLASRFVMSCIVMHFFALYLLFLPPLLSLDTEADAAATPYDYGVDDPSLLLEQPGKPPLDHQILPILLSTACIRVVYHVTAFR